MNNRWIEIDGGEPIGWLDKIVDAWDENDGRAEIYETDSGKIKYRFWTYGNDHNENIIRAMRSNLLQWHRSWYSSKKGGRHVFKVRPGYKQSEHIVPGCLVPLTSGQSEFSVH